MKVLLIQPEVRLDDKPFDFPFWAGIFASIVEKKGGQVAILDLNAIRMNFGGDFVPVDVLRSELESEKWDLIGIGGLTTMYRRIKQLIKLIRKDFPESTIISGGGWSTYNPDEILKLVPELDIVCIGEGEETFSEIYNEIENNSRNFQKIKGICFQDENHEIQFTEPRALISDLDTVPYPHYDLYELDIYFRYSSYPTSKDAYLSKRRASAVWERGCPRGCTFCSHNGMSRIDIQNIYGEGDRRKGETIARKIDKDNDTFMLPARWPSPKYAVDNVKLLKEKYDIDFLTILDENMTSNRKWTEQFCELYIAEGLDKSVKWGTLGDAPSVAVQPTLVKTMKDAGCSYISFGFESASDKVLAQDIQKGQTRMHLQKTVDAIKKVGLRPLATFMIGNEHEDINDLLETVDFCIQNNIEVDAFICIPYVGSPIFYNNKDIVLEQYDERLKLTKDDLTVDQNIRKQWQLEAIDKFMKDCGDATLYTATVSKNFTIPDLIALKRFMYKHDTGRMIKMAHQRFEETGLSQWEVSEKWKKYDPKAIANEQLSEKVKLATN